MNLLVMPGNRESVSPDEWDEALSPLSLADDQVHAWRIKLGVGDHDAAWAPVRRLLSVDEKARAKHFVFARDRRRFTDARAALRCLLAAYVSERPEQLEFSVGPYGKPELSGPLAEAGWQFNVAHSWDVAVVAIARGRPVGIDIEYVRPGVAGREIAERYFSPREVRELLSLAEAERELAFFRCWTRKEAYLKALGTGLSTPLDSFSVSLLPDEPVELRTRQGCDSAGRWTICELAPAAGLIGALAVAGDFDLRCGIWRPNPSGESAIWGG